MQVHVPKIKLSKYFKAKYYGQQPSGREASNPKQGLNMSIEKNGRRGRMQMEM